MVFESLTKHFIFIFIDFWEKKYHWTSKRKKLTSVSKYTLNLSCKNWFDDYYTQSNLKTRKKIKLQIKVRINRWFFIKYLKHTQIFINFIL
jgi:hypothetical protein